VCVLHSVESYCVCLLHSVERCVCVLHSEESASVDCTDYIHVIVHDKNISVILAMHGIKLPDGGSLVIRNIIEQF